MNATVTLPTVVWTFTTAALIIWILLRPRERAPWQILAMIVVFAVEPFSSAVMDAENRHFPLKFDHYLQAIDQTLGVTAFSVARLLPPVETAILFEIYKSLSFAMIFWYALHLKTKDGRPREVVSAYLLAFCLGPCLYLIVPACGPRHAFPALFPWGQPTVDLALVPLNYWPNAIPSLHVTTALLLLLLAGPNRVMRTVASLYLAGTVLATLAFEHYTIDLIVAVPFACFAAAAARRRFASALMYSIVVLAWLFVIRLNTPFLLAHPYVLRAAAFLTIVCSLAAKFQHAEASEAKTVLADRSLGEIADPAPATLQ